MTNTKHHVVHSPRKTEYRLQLSIYIKKYNSLIDHVCFVKPCFPNFVEPQAILYIRKSPGCTTKQKCHKVPVIKHHFLLSIYPKCKCETWTCLIEHNIILAGIEKKKKQMKINN